MKLSVLQTVQHHKTGLPRHVLGQYLHRPHLFVSWKEGNGLENEQGGEMVSLFWLKTGFHLEPLLGICTVVDNFSHFLLFVNKTLFASFRSLPHQSVSTLSGSVAPSWLPCPPSSRCGSQNRNMMKPAHPLSTVNASKHVYKKDHYYLVTTLRMTTLWVAGCWTPAMATLTFYFVTMSLLLLLQMPCDTKCM